MVASGSSLLLREDDVSRSLRTRVTFRHASEFKLAMKKALTKYRLDASRFQSVDGQTGANVTKFSRHFSFLKSESSHHIMFVL